jgi:amino acid transporter
MERAIDTRSAVAINVITMIGIGPLITIPLVLATLGGSLALLGWIGGAVVALCDGLVWAELASRFPRSGGTYVYLRESFGHERLGRLLAFLFNWQFLLYAPCLLASGYIGFADYATYLVPGLGSWWGMHACALGIGCVTIVLLLRRTSRVAATSLLLGAVAVLTLALVAVAALTHANWHMAMQLPGPVRFGTGLLAGFSSALFVTLYDYVGYADVALVGDEVREPNRTIPRSIVISVLLVAGLYVALQSGVLGVIPWRSLVGADGTPTAASQYVGSLVIERSWGVLPARVVTGLVLVTAFASLYGNLLGFSRIPFAAARDGAFFPAFARLHPDKHIPEVALLAVGGLSLVASFFTLGEVIAFLTAGIVLIQSIMQIVALALVRRRGPAPFRMPLYPLPAIVALVGWILAFAYTGPLAIAIGVGWLVLGIAAYLVLARAQRAWPFAAATVTLLLLLLPRPSLAAPTGAWATWHTSRIVQMNGYPVFEVNGKPFFVYGAAFFYERVPRDEWRQWLETYRNGLHVNTIDLYVPWNWQEPRAGELDFTGRTNPRRDLLGVLKIVRELGFKIVLRPGPLIRNEWRNGGYPDWLLERPAYDMPLHDVLEGRYPATATLQNGHADAAADEWLNNATHIRYAAAWLHDVLSVVAPYSHDVIAVALDDDQGAYLDNDTWPAPHWHAYVGWLKSTVRRTAGPHVPVFINTYEMKVTADSPAWAWGDWYQSDAYSIGDHDREQIDFSTALLGSQAHVPVMMAEFQAGWLQAADENAPRPADPTNTALALSEFLADGAHGIVNFPVQDTLYPAGWEVPWANWAYDWGAALTACRYCDRRPSYGAFSARFAPTAAFGEEIARWGTLLAATHPVVDAHIVWPVSLFAAGTSYSATDFAAATLAMLKQCRERGLICNIRDVRYDRVDRDGAPYVLPIVVGDPAALAPDARAHLAFLRRTGRLIPNLARLRSRGFSGEHDGATLLLEPSGKRGFVVASNWTSHTTEAGPYFVRLDSKIVRTARIWLAPRSTTLVAVREREQARPERNRRLLGPIADYFIPFFPFGSGSWPLQSPCSTCRSNLFRFDPFDDGYGAVELVNRSVFPKGSAFGALIFVPHAGARIACLCDSDGVNFAASIGMLRDAVDPEPTPSSRDYIAAFTHPLPAGTFNRKYVCDLAHVREATAQVTCEYEAPDVPAGGGDFERSLTMNPQYDEVDVSERMTPRDPNSPSHLKSISGFAVDAGDVVEPGSSCFGVYRPSARELGRLCWRPDDLLTYDVRRTRGAAILTLHFKRNDVEMRLGVLPAATESQARALVGGNT